MEVTDKLSKRVSNFFGNNRDNKKNELTNKQLKIIKELPVRGEGKPPISSKEVMESIDMDFKWSTISNHLTEMREKGYIIKRDGGYLRKTDEELWGKEEHLAFVVSIGFSIFFLVQFFIGYILGSNVSVFLGGLGMFYCILWMIISLKD